MSTLNQNSSRMNGSLTTEPDSFSDEAWSLLLIAEQSARRWRHQNLDVEHLIEVLFRNKKFQKYINPLPLNHEEMHDILENFLAELPINNQSDLFVEQLDRDETILKSYIFKSAYPLTIGTIDLSSDTTNALETFECTWRYQHFEASGVNF